MADTVRYLLEEMIPELEDLQARGLFSKSELQKVVKVRTNFEYLLKRPAVLKNDFLRYIQYEKKLEDLRKHRKQKMGSEAQNGAADHAIVRRIHFIFQRALQKFRGDLRLWMKWLQFSRQIRSSRRTSQILTRALQLHPRAAGLWSYAAAWEFEQRQNAVAARALMQRGLRICSSSQPLWCEYFRMELLYVQKLRSRRKVLGIQNPCDNSAEGLEGGEQAAADVLRGAVALVVYRNAIAAVPKSVSLRQQFLQILRQFAFPGLEQLRHQICHDLRQNVADDAMAWDVLARDAAFTSHQAAMEVYEEGVQRLGSGRIYDLYTSFLCECLAEGQLEMQQAETSAIAKRMMQLCEQACSLGVASPELTAQWVSLAARCGAASLAGRAAELACQLHPASPQLWQQCLALQLQRWAAQGPYTSVHTEAECIHCLEDVAVQAVGSTRSCATWLCAIESLLAVKGNVGVLTAELLQQLTMQRQGGPLQAGLSAIAGVMVDGIRQSEGIESARAFYKQVLALPSPGGPLFHRVLTLELQQREEGHGMDEKGLRQLFEAAVDAHGADDANMWLLYLCFDGKSARGMGSTYWRALHALRDPDSFVHAFQSLMQGS